MYKRQKLNINIYYKEDGDTIMKILEKDFNDFFESYLKKYIY